MPSWKEHSKTEWRSLPDPNTAPADDRIKIGCLQRIADATEKMAQSYSALIEERDRYKRWYENEERMRRSADRRIISLKGVITKLKKGRKP